MRRELPAFRQRLTANHRGQEAPEWQFAVSHSTWAALSVKLDGREVWSKPVVVRPGNYDNWASFWE